MFESMLETVMKGRGVTRQSRKCQIMAILFHNQMCGVQSTSTKQIANLCGLKKSSHVTGMLKELMHDGYVDFTEKQWRSGVTIALWLPAIEAEYTEEYSRVAQYAARVVAEMGE
jgi:DNA-binding IclR family transcriptional regulator